MKQVILGRDKGYLIPKKVVEDKLREKFEVLKDKTINSLQEGYKSCSIDYEPQPKIEKKKDHAIIYYKKQEVTETLVFKKELLNKLFGLKGTINDIRLKTVENKKIIQNYIGHSIAEEEGYLFDNTDVYYFFEIKDYETEDICEMN